MNNINKLWNESEEKTVKPEDIIFQDYIKIKNHLKHRKSKEFILTNSKWIYLNNNICEKYIDLHNINIRFQKSEFIIIINNHKNYFELFFDNILKYLNWKKKLTKLCNIGDFSKNYSILELICKNNKSSIFKIQKNENKKYYACKYLRKNNNPIKEIKNEIRIMRTLNKHPNVIKLKEVYENENSFFWVMEFANLFNLKDFIDKKLKTDNNELIKGILDGIKYIHSNNIIHRDIKPSNIFLHKEQDGKIIPKIGDLGISFFVKEGPIDAKVGTLGYIAPEILNHKKLEKFNFNEEIDIYSIGCLIYFIFFKNIIFQYENLCDLKFKNKNNEYRMSDEFYQHDKKFQKVILKCLYINPKKRIVLLQLIKYFYNRN